MSDIDKLADDLVGDANELIAAVLRKHAKGVIAGTRELYDELKATRQELQNARICIDTIVTNLREGASSRDVLAWLEVEGCKLLLPFDDGTQVT